MATDGKQPAAGNGPSLDEMIVDASPNFVSIIGPDFRFRRANRTCELANGVPRGQMVGRLVADFLGETRFADIRPLLERCLMGETLRNTGWATFQRLGECYLDITFLPIEVAGEALILVVGIDLTDQKRIEEALRESEERYALALRGTNDGIFDWKLDSDILSMSPRYQEIIGLSNCPEMRSVEWMRFVHPEDRESFLGAVLSHFKGKTPWFDCEFRVIAADGSVHWVSDRGLALRDGDGRAYRMAGSMADVTERKQNELDLLEAKDQAEMANRAKSEFLANMSHELRTPLNAIIGFSDVMLHKTFGPLGNLKYVEYTSAIHESGQHLLELINDVLDVSAIEAGKLEMADGEVDPAAMVEASVRLVRARAEKGRVRLRVEVSDRLPKLRGDERRLKQVLLNLLSNAVKFTPQNGEVRLTASPDETGGMEFVISDTGVGMDAETLALAFRPFERAKDSKIGGIEGTGLGLPLARALIEAHDGRIELESEPGRGTVVRVTLPRERLL